MIDDRTYRRWNECDLLICRLKSSYFDLDAFILKATIDFFSYDVEYFTSVDFQPFVKTDFPVPATHEPNPSLVG